MTALTPEQIASLPGLLERFGDESVDAIRAYAKLTGLAVSAARTVVAQQAEIEELRIALKEDQSK